MQRTIRCVAFYPHFRILLVPVGSISRKTFDQWTAEIRTLENLRLGDIPLSTEDEKGKHVQILLLAHFPANR